LDEPQALWFLMKYFLFFKDNQGLD
jgi:hypothetical protein